MIKNLGVSCLIRCVTSAVHAQQSFGHWAVMQCQPVQDRLALINNDSKSMQTLEDNKIVAEGETLKIIAQNYKYRLEELQSQINSLNKSIKLQRESIKMIEFTYQNGDASTYELLQSMSLLRDTESRLILFESELKREKGYQELVEKYCKKQTN